MPDAFDHSISPRTAIHRWLQSSQHAHVPEETYPSGTRRKGSRSTHQPPKDDGHSPLQSLPGTGSAAKFTVSRGKPSANVKAGPGPPHRHSRPARRSENWRDVPETNAKKPSGKGSAQVLQRSLGVSSREADEVTRRHRRGDEETNQGKGQVHADNRRRSKSPHQLKLQPSTLLPYQPFVIDGPTLRVDSPLANRPATPLHHFERRPRRKTREDRYQLKHGDKKKSGSVGSTERKPGVKRRRHCEKSGAALLHDFAAPNVSDDRLTVSYPGAWLNLRENNHVPSLCKGKSQVFLPKERRRHL